MEEPVENREPRSYSERRARERREARRRLEERVVRPVAPKRVRRDPLRRARRSPLRRAARLVAYALVALGLHAGIVISVTGVGGALGSNETPPSVEKVVVRVVDPPPLPAPIEKPEVAALETRVEPEAPEPEAVQRVEPRPRPRKRSAPMPADPVDVREPEPAAQAESKRRVVGLSMESTVTGGSGPAFAVGNTRMGRTGDLAEDPGGVEKLSPSAKGSGSGETGPNRVASSVPGSSVKLVKPKRLSSPALVYPALLKSQGIEGNVAVMIRIAADGNVLSAKVLKSSGYPEFDAAARAAALKERFSPATRGGDPVEYTLKYTYRFRIKNT
jgi:protein TonB